MHRLSDIAKYLIVEEHKILKGWCAIFTLVFSLPVSSTEKLGLTGQMFMAKCIQCNLEPTSSHLPESKQDVLLRARLHAVVHNRMF